jgi:oxygen-dependent protoporphyrinogen oxidase
VGVVTKIPARPTRVLVVGGGISGLAAASALLTADPSLSVTVLEGSPQVGGKLALGEVAGLTVDVGAEAMLNRRPEGVALARAAGLEANLVYPASVAANVLARGIVRPMPPTLMGVPTDLKALADSGIISRSGIARARLDLVLPPTHFDGQDVSVGWLIEERLGREIVDRLVEPLLGGVYAGHARELSAQATVPMVVALLNKDKSFLRAAGSAAAGSSDIPVFAGLLGGMGTLPLALAERLSVRTDAMVRELNPLADGRWQVVLGPTNATETIEADAVILATPAAPSARLLDEAAPDAALELARIDYASSAVITMAFSAREFPQVIGSGLLVPPVEGRAVKAATYSFAKWDWVRELGRNDDGDDLLVMRTSIGRHRGEQELQVEDERLVEMSLHDLARAIGLSVRPVDWHVQRWGGGLPQYAVGHLQRVERIRGAVAKVPGLAVCGAAYDGVGIPACIASAQRAADETLKSLAGRPAV